MNLPFFIVIFFIVVLLLFIFKPILEAMKPVEKQLDSVFQDIHDVIGRVNTPDELDILYKKYEDLGIIISRHAQTVEQFRSKDKKD